VIDYFSTGNNGCINYDLFPILVLIGECEQKVNSFD